MVRHDYSKRDSLLDANRELRCKRVERWHHPSFDVMLRECETWELMLRNKVLLNLLGELGPLEDYEPGSGIIRFNRSQNAFDNGQTPYVPVITDIRFEWFNACKLPHRDEREIDSWCYNISEPPMSLDDILDHFVHVCNLPKDIVHKWQV